MLGLLGVIVLYTSAAFVELRLKGDHNRRSTYTDSTSLPSYRHLVVKDLDQRVILNISDSPMIKSKAVRDNPLAALDYDLIGDTLIINDLGLRENDQGDFTIYALPELTSITSISSYLSMYRFDIDSLTINQSGGGMTIYNSRGLQYLDLTLIEGGTFDISDIPIEDVNVTVDEGEARLRSDIHTIRGNVKNRSSLTLNEVRDIQLSKDETSTIRMYQ